MKNKKLYILAVLALAFSSCKKELDEVNINPNAPEIPQPDYLLTGTTKTTVDTYWGVTNNMNSSLLFAQQWAKVQYTEEDRFIFSNSSFTSLWSTGYAQSIAGFNKIIELGDAQGNTNYKGVALVLRSWVFSLLTDTYGDIPYSQAGKIKQFVTPVYDKQKDVYYGILSDLKAAQTALDPASKAIAGDVIYGNSIASWKKLANALRLRIALRIADKDAAKAKQVIDEIQAEGGTYISSNSENAILKYDVSPQQNPVAASFETRNDYRISKTIVDKLFSLNDPRLPVYASRTENTTPQTYVGIPNGSTNSEASAIGLANSSKPGTYFLDAKAPAVIFSYAELLFDRAEAAARGFTTENAEDLYKQAITASWQQYAISTTNIDSYFALPAVKYDAANYKKSIGEQKWIALFGQGLEAWTEQRRLDYPQLTASVNTVLNGKIPVRFIYPGTEQSLNGQNYKNAVSNQGADLLTTKLWFDAF